MLKGTIPVADEDYDLSEPVDTGKAFLGVGVGFAMLFGAAAVGRSLWNRVSRTTGAVNEVEVF